MAQYESQEIKEPRSDMRKCGLSLTEAIRCAYKPHRIAMKGWERKMPNCANRWDYSVPTSARKGACLEAVRGLPRKGA